MGTRSKQTKKQSHPSMTFEQQVAIATSRALQGEMERYAKQAEDNLRSDIAFTFRELGLKLQALIDITLEKVGLTEEDYYEKVLSVEDQTDDYERADREAQNGDRVRFTIRDTLAEGGKEDKMLLNNLSSEKSQLVGDLDKNLLGMKAGETKLVNVTLGDETKKDFAFEIKMKRVSAKVKKDVEAKQEAQEIQSDGSSSTGQESQAQGA